MTSNDEECDNKCLAILFLICIVPFAMVNSRLYRANYINSLPQKLCHVDGDTIYMYNYYAFSSGFKIGNMLVTDIYDKDNIITNTSTFIYPSSKFTSNSESEVKRAADDIRESEKFVCHYDKSYDVCYDRPPETGVLFIFIWIPCAIILVLLSCCAYVNYKEYKKTTARNYVPVRQSEQITNFDL